MLIHSCGKCPNIPTESDLDYCFVPNDLIPPVGERYLMHLIHHPEDYEDELITYKRIPKKQRCNAQSRECRCGSWVGHSFG